jgi:undecaprenyl diphosphate synthase
VELVFHRGIETLTVYGFPTENRKRSQPEVDALIKIFTDYLIEMNEKLKNENVKVNIWGTSAFLIPHSTKQLSTFKKTQNIKLLTPSISA